MASTTQVFDLFDDRQAAEVRSRLRLGSKDGDQKLEKALGAALRGKRRRAPKSKPKDDVLADANIITGIGRTESGGVAATAVSAIVGGTFFSRASLAIYDIDSGTTLAETHVGPEFEAGKYLPMSVEGPASPTGGPLDIILTVLYQKTNTTPPVPLSVTHRVQELAAGAPVVLQPALSANPEPPLRVGLSTGGPRPGLDYWYDEKLRPFLTLRLPFVGAQRFASRVLTPVFQKKHGTVAEILLFSPTKGGAIRASSKTMNALKRDVDANGVLLSWQLTWSGKVSHDRSAQFGGSAFTKEAPMIGLFMLGVKTETSGEHLVWTSVGGPAPSASASGINALPDVSYVWR